MTHRHSLSGFVAWLFSFHAVVSLAFFFSALDCCLCFLLCPHFTYRTYQPCLSLTACSVKLRRRNGSHIDFTVSSNIKHYCMPYSCASFVDSPRPNPLQHKAAHRHELAPPAQVVPIGSTHSNNIFVAAPHYRLPRVWFGSLAAPCRSLL